MGAIIVGAATGAIASCAPMVLTARRLTKLVRFTCPQERVHPDVTCGPQGRAVGDATCPLR